MKFLEDLLGDPKDILIMLFLWTFLNLYWIGLGIFVVAFLIAG